MSRSSGLPLCLLVFGCALHSCPAADRILFDRLAPTQATLFISNADGSADLYRIHPDRTGLERLTDDPAYDDQAAFSPDGGRLVFVSTRANGQTNLWILDAATHKATPLTSGHGGDFRPSWSPDASIFWARSTATASPDALSRSAETFWP